MRIVTFKWKSAVLIPALLLLLQTLCLPCAFAAPPEPDLSAACALNLIMQNAAGEAISGGKLVLYHVAEWKRAGSGFVWDFTPAFQSCALSETGLEDNANAEPLARFAAERALPGREVSPGDAGTARFGGLSAGLYLAVQTEAAPGYLPMSPFLLTLPVWSEAEGRYLHALTATPKSAIQPEPTSPPAHPPPVSGKPGLPQTGQLWWPVPLLGLSGILLLVGSAALRRKASRDEEA